MFLIISSKLLNKNLLHAILTDIKQNIFNPIFNKQLIFLKIRDGHFNKSLRRNAIKI